MAEEEKTLRGLIEGRLKIKIDAIWLIAEEEYHSSQEGDNSQGTEHCKTVESNLYKLISDDKRKKLKQIDLFVLSAAACLHDIGKIDAREGEDHGIRSMEIILELHRELGLDRAQAVAVAHIARVHANGRLEELPMKPIAVGNSGEVDIIELAALFRLADMLDTTCQRASEILGNIKFRGGNFPSKWRGRQSITGWYLDKENKIILQATPKKKDEIEAAYILWAMMNEELSKIRPHLKHYGYPYELGELEKGDIFLMSKQKKKTTELRPFPGMAFYTENDAQIFKGRDREIDDLLSIVSAYPITLLIGESGAGKTSLIHAGLFRRLDALSWKYVWTRPFDSPVENIKMMLWAAFFEGKPDDEMQLLDVMKQVAERCTPNKLLIVIDQCEEILNTNKRILDELSLALMTVQSAVMPNLKVLLSFRDDALVKLNTRLLRRITGSFRHFPSIELEGLTREGAEEALLAGLERAGKKLDSRHTIGEKELIEILLDDIQKGSNRLYPPYFQMVAETLCKKAGKNDSIITKEIYFGLGSADSIIARYLVELLEEFGAKKGKAEKILIFLTSSAGKKVQISLAELQQKTEIGHDELKEILSEMIDLRMVRTITDDKFEIIHDYLGKIIDEELVKEEDRTVKFLEEQLNVSYQNYNLHREPISSHLLMARLYRNRERVEIDESKYPLILCTILGKEAGLGWFWLRDLDKRRLLKMIKEHMFHEMREIRDHAVNLFLEIVAPEERDEVIEMLRDVDPDVQKAAMEKFAEPIPKDRDAVIEMFATWWNSAKAGYTLPKTVRIEDKDEVIKMLHDEAWYVRRAALESLAMIATSEDKDEVIEMIRDVDPDVREAAIRVFAKITPEDKDEVIEMLRDEAWYVRRAALEALAMIATSEDKDEVIEMIRDIDPDVREAAIRVFAKITPEDKDRLIELIHDEDPDVRRAAMEALGVVNTSEERQYLLDLLSDESQGYGEREMDFFQALSKLDKIFYCPSKQRN